VQHTPSSTDSLTARQEAFAQAVGAQGLPLADAYEVAYSTLSASRATIRTNAHKLARNLRVARRIQELRDATAGRSVRSTAALIAELEEAVSADPAELVRIEVGCCPECWSDGDHGRDANPDCGKCFGQGAARVHYASTDAASPGARRLVRGIETWPDGSLKRLHLHDQTALRIELHRLRGLHVERSVNLNVNTSTRDLVHMTAEQRLDFLESLRPTAAGTTQSAGRLPVTVDSEASPS